MMPKAYHIITNLGERGTKNLKKPKKLNTSSKEPRFFQLCKRHVVCSENTTGWTENLTVTTYNLQDRRL